MKDNKKLAALSASRIKEAVESLSADFRDEWDIKVPKKIEVNGDVFDFQEALNFSQFL